MKHLFATLALAAATAQAAEPVKINIQADQPGPVIARQIYGQFGEHLGAGIYEGLWVGTDSKIPNVRGWRTDVVTALKALKVPVLRWPGGCFADEYHWRDGIGPQAQRPPRVNTSWGGVIEPNSVGTHEFMDLADQLGTEVYINANLGSGTVAEMAQWLEYLTAEGDTALARERRANGRDKPWRIQYWGIGNESWGCGGHMKPSYYADQYKQWATFAKAPRGNRPKLVASGGQELELHWTETLSAEIKDRMAAITHHQYSLPTRDWKKKGSAVNFPESEWISTLAVPQTIDGYLAKHREILDRNDPAKKVAIYFDEWGSWYDPEPGTDPGFLVQRNTLRDAVLSALHFHVFHRHADRVKMANIAQMVNVLQAVVITDKERMVLTPTYHAFAMHLPFMDATSLPVQLSGVPDYTLGKYSIPALSASAAKAADGKLILSLSNTNPNQPLPLQLAVGGKGVRAVSGQLLTAATMDAQNWYDAPDRVKPQPFKAEAKGGVLALNVPAKSVLVLEVQP
ncbi:alpha-L-arabinofuranosidase C-terminal domain-containing protein [Roseateles asaccharophilus]|uniref:non-reducing end alpha-L-arabinofuranosidase n=2 Tax=Roseateles asaccharophilus TaxID=582607 RepID=A0ABU2A1S4_9BURK|nr:alpha-L-arabinofuranosidase C-terminal domain-containing protein [Roseateles asaccharophilus]MDR7331140.1 alpha-N-arabinofuranosidase [Roseateles asaccharophilus]